MMIMQAKGNYYILKERISKFNYLDIVVAVEDNDVPYCVELKDYVEDYSPFDYMMHEIRMDAFIIGEDIFPIS
jgi:hypothetical protein